jgi:hypothetical protein
MEISKHQQMIEEQITKQKELIDGIVRSQNQYATKQDIEQFAKDNGVTLDIIQKDLDKLKAEVISINVTTTNSKSQKDINLPSTGTGEKNPDSNPTCKDGSCVDQFGYMKTEQKLTLNEDFGTIKVPIGEVGFKAWNQQPWNTNILGREYHITTVVGVDENQRTYYYNKVGVKVGDNDYTLPITRAETKQELPEAKFSWWNPRLFAGMDGGVNLTKTKGEFTPSLNLGIMSYGRYKSQPDWSILSVGAGYSLVSQSAQIVITPVTYNIGKHIPLVDNTYLGPSLHVGTDGGISVMFGLRVGL